MPIFLLKKHPSVARFFFTKMSSSEELLSCNTVKVREGFKNLFTDFDFDFDSDSKSVLEALAPGEEGAVADGKPWKGDAEGDLPIRGEGKSSSPMSRSSRLSSSNIGISL